MSATNDAASNPSEGSPTERTSLMSSNTASNTNRPLGRTYSSGASDTVTMPEAPVNADSNDTTVVGDGNRNQRSRRQGEEPPRRDSGSASTGEDEEFMYGAKHVVKIFIPVTVCMVIVIVTVSAFIQQNQNVYMIYTPFRDETDDTGTKLWQALANSGILLCVVIAMTVLLFVLYKYRCYKVINGWLMFSSVLMLFFFSYMHLQQMLTTLNVPLDYITAALIVWNFGVGGIFGIHWKSPLLVQQAYLISVSVLSASLFIKLLPGWTSWAVCGVMVVWDLVAVLCPMGPLRLLVETAQERNEAIFPALIYSSMAWTVNMADDGGSSKEKKKQENAGEGNDEESDSDDGGFREHMANGVSGHGLEDSTAARSAVQALGDMARDEPTMQRQIPSEGAVGGAAADESAVDVRAGKVKKRQSRPVDAAGEPQPNGSERQERGAVPGASEDEPDSDEERGIKIGLGDFIFYSLLVGKASLHGDWNTTLACFVAIIIGLSFTLLLLAIWRKAVPALPISITFGLVFYFATSVLVQPFMDKLNSEQVYI